MLFKITYAIREEMIHDAQTQFATTEEKWYNLKLIGRWHEPSSTGVMIVETDNAQDVAKYCQQWNRLCKMEVTPVTTDEQVAEVLQATLNN